MRASRVVFVLVLLVVARVTLGYVGTYDIRFDDESIYLDEGIHGGRQLPLAESSPLYPLFYRVLAVVVADPVRLYDAMWLVTTASLPLLMYALSRRSGAPLWAAAFVSVAWACSGSLLTWPFVSKFAAAVLLSGALLATYCRDPRFAAGVSAITVAVASYARPELAIVGMVAIGAVLVSAAVAWVRRRGRRALHTVAAVAVASGVLVLALGRPLAHGRAFWAFEQHYTLNVAETAEERAADLGIDPWNDSTNVMQGAFGKAETIAGAARANPRAFAWHVKTNLRWLPFCTSVARPVPSLSTGLALLVGGLLVSVVVAGSVGLVRDVLRRRRRGPLLARWRIVRLAVVLATVPAMLVVYPREHYAIPLFVLLLTALAARARSFQPRISRRFRRAAPFVLVAIVFAILVAFRAPPPATMEGRSTIATLRSLHLTGKRVVLEADHARGVYASLDFVRVAQWAKDDGFWDFVDEKKIDVIVLDERLRTDRRFADDPEFEKFVTSPAPEDGYTRTPVPGTTVVIAVRRSEDAAKEP